MTEAIAPTLAPTAPWVVVKFGGTSVSTRPRWENIRRIAAAHRARGRRVVIVVSALSGITDQLKAIAESRTDDARCAAARDEIVARHEAMFGELEGTSRVALDRWLADLDRLVADPRRARGDVAWQAEVFALGELMSSTLGAAFLSEVGAGVLPTVWLDARDHLRAEALPNQNAWGRHLSASVAAVPDPALARALAARGDTFITQGFIARNADGETVVLGRGGSDTSAGYFGALLKAELVEIWTDVPGMFTANPRQVPEARLLADLDRLIADSRRASGDVAWQAEVFALGELMSSTLGAAFLAEVGSDTLPARWLDARQHLRAEALPNQNAWGRYLSASVAAVPDAAFARALAGRGDVFVTQGFVARNANGETVVLGRG
ncbi:MAG TPA: hypothetical protein VKB52_05645, partial [Rhodanobacteraceae bacterium]|nr:hypothetical protein [Rhodanobacteraceae bacterium]